jgi:hypothetical protein
MRAAVKKYLPVLRRQIQAQGWGAIRDALVKGRTNFLSKKDRFEAVKILDAEQGADV